MAIVSQGELFTRRTERLQSFFDEVRRYLYNRCIDENTPIMAIDFFVNELFIHFCKMNELPFMELLRMLTGDSFLEETYARYKTVL